MALVFLALGLSPAYSQNAPNSGDDFDITQNAKGMISITGYKGKARQVNIPETIEGIKVTEIGGNSFNGNKNITSVTFQGTIPSTGSSYYVSKFLGDLDDKFFAANRTPGTYTTTAPVSENSTWTKQ